MQKVLKKVQGNFFILLPVLAILFVFVKFFISSDTLNSLEAIPTTYLSSNLTAASQAAGTLITALSSSGFTVGSSALVNNKNSTTATSFTYTSDGNTTTATRPYGIAVNGNYMYVTHNGDDAISVYDISTVDSPTYLTTFSTTCTIGDILVASSTLYVTNYTANNFRVYDLTSSSTAPSFVRTVSTGNYPIGIAKSSANYIYVANNTDNTIKIYDAASSTNPTLSATYSLPSNNPTGLAVKGTNLYVAHYNQAIVRVLSISTATSPTNVTTIAVGTNPMGLAVYNNVLLVSNYGSNNIYQWNITTASAPAASGNASFSSAGTSPIGMAFSSDGNEMYLANNGSNSITAYTTTVKEKYVSWNWKCGTTSGCTMVTYTGTGANATFSHSLGSTPVFMMVKRTNTTGNWMVYHQALLNTKYINLNGTGAPTTDATVWNNATPTASVFSVGTNAAVNTSGGTYQAYLFAEKAGFSKFGSYVGNGSADGTFVYTGFKPKYLIIRSTTAARNWLAADGSRYTNNPAGLDILLESTSGQESNSSYNACVDFLANGFKLRCTTSNMNGSGETHIFAAFADYPFEYATTNGNSISIASSTRFNGTNAYLSKTPSTTGSRTTFTWSGWVKKSKFTTEQEFMIGDDGVQYSAIAFRDDVDVQLRFQQGNSSGQCAGGCVITATGKMRDPSAWYHIVVAVDTTQAVANERIRFYVNGVRLTTSTANDGTLSQNQNTFFNYSSATHYLGGWTRGGYFNGYLSDVYFIDGQQLGPTSFAGTDSNGRWAPKTYSGAYGTNGFHLTFSNPASLGADSSGQGNNWTTNNIATTDNVPDSPTNNYATLNPVNVYNFGTGLLTVSNGALVGSNSAGTSMYGYGTLAPQSGKWCFEATANFATVGQAYVGYRGASASTQGIYGAYIGNGNTMGLSGSPTFASYVNGDVITSCIDYSGGTVRFYKNGSLQGTGDYSITSFDSTYNLAPIILTNNADTTSGNWTVNFGQGGQSGLTYDSASGGYFKYTPPSGYKALSSVNMISAGTTNSSLAVSKNYFNTFIYNGNGSSQSFSSLAFQPDFIWIKDRTTAVDHVLYGDGSSIVNTVASFFQWFEF